jgi:hypothetical protein
VGAGIDATRLRVAAVAGDWKQIQAMGTGALPALARLYEASSEKDRATIAFVFYSLGWKSPDAKRVLMADVHTQDRSPAATSIAPRPGCAIPPPASSTGRPTHCWPSSARACPRIC